MRQRLSTIGIILLVATIVLIGVAGCSRQAKERQPDATEAAGAGTPVASPSSNTSPAPGETVVSAVTPSGQSPGAAPTAPAPAGQTPAAPLATAGPPPGEATAVAPPPASPGGSIWHTVQPGETLSSIARRYGASWQAIAQANGLTNPNQIYVGQKLKIPTSGSGGSSGGTGSGCRIRHTVKQGDWVWQIARNYGVSPYDILAANGLSIQAANTILPGTVLCIP